MSAARLDQLQQQLPTEIEDHTKHSAALLRNRISRDVIRSLRAMGLDRDQVDGALQVGLEKAVDSLILANGIAPERISAALQPHVAKDDKEPRFDRDRAQVGAEAFSTPPNPPEMIVDQFMSRSVGAFLGAGGSSKSTISLHQAIHLILDRPLYGFDIRRHGAVLLLTAEDGREIIEWQLYRMIQDMGLPTEAARYVRDNLYIEDCTSRITRFVEAGTSGRLLRTRVIEELADEYRGAGLAAIYADPQNAFGPGERFVNDGEGELMRAGAWLSKELDCAVRFTHHVGKAQARSGAVDQYAGRGGSAGADNARFVHVLATHKADGDGFAAPSTVTPEDIAAGRLLRLTVEKLSYGQRPTWPIWLLRRGFTFEHVRSVTTDPAEAERDRLRRLHAFIQDQAGNGIRHTRTSLDDRLRELGMTRSDMRSALHVAIERGHVVERDLPEGERIGAKKTYLAAGLTP